MTTAVVERQQAGSGRPSNSVALAARGLRKQFGDVLAADDVTINAFRGEILAILGENGAGKSTLMKMLYGYYHPDSGHLELNGRPVRFHSPSDARAHGIGMVFQNFTLIPALTVVENVALVQGGRGPILNRRALGDRIIELSERYGLAVDPGAVVRDLSVGERQRAEILKVLASGATTVILDEPTSVLAPHEVDSLLTVLRHLRDDGFAVLLITHKMREVFECADRVAVLRRGRIVGEGGLGDFTQGELLRLMLGDRESQIGRVVAREAGAGGPGLALSHVTTGGADGRSALRDVTLDVPAGRIVGVAAVAGNGQSAFADVFLGLASLKSGRVFIGGEDLTSASTRIRLDLGLGVISEDPVALAAVGPMTVGENLLLTQAPVDGKGRLLRLKRLARATAACLGGSPFPMPSAGRALESLSGGNVQRVVIVREMQGHCRFLLAYYPSRGLDLASSRAVQRLLLEFRERGVAILLVSEDLDEIEALSDDVVVLHHGRLVGSFPRGQVDPLRIGHLMTGGH